MKQRLLNFAAFILLATTPVVAQEGIPYIARYDSGDEYTLRHWSICQGDGNEMLFANRMGLTVFDGQEWINYKLNIIPVVIKRDPVSGVIYAGSINDYGIIKNSPQGEPLFESLCSDTLPADVIDGIRFTEEAIIFTGEESISMHSRNDLSSYKRWYAPDGKTITGFMEAGGDYFINVSGQGLHRIDADTLFPIVTGYLTANCKILFSIDHGDGMVLTGRSDNSLHLFDGIRYYPWETKSSEYLQNNSLADGFAVTEDIYAFTTLYGGVLLVNRHNGSIIHTLNYANGLTDDEIFASGTDNNKGLWLSHGMGVCRIDLALPLRDYSIYPGLEGTVTSTLIQNGILWVSTNKGLFYLEEVRDFKSIEVTRIRQPDPLPNQINLAVTTDTTRVVVKANVKEDATVTKDDRGVRTFFNRLLGKEKKLKQKEEKKTEPPEKLSANKEKEREVMSDETITNSGKPLRSESLYFNETISVLKSINHAFKKVEGLDYRCSLIEGTDHGLLAATSSGLWWINDRKSEIVIKTRYVHDIISTPDPCLFYAASDRGIFPVRYNGRRWEAYDILSGINEPVYSLLLTGDNKIWASGNNLLFTLSPNNGKGRADQSVRAYTFKSDFPERAILTVLSDTVLLLTENNTLFFSKEENLLIPHTGYPRDEGKGLRYKVCTPDEIWINSGEGWKIIAENRNGKDTASETLLSLFGNIRSMHYDSEGNLWVADGESHIYRISDQESKNGERNFTLNIKSLTNRSGSWYDMSRLVFEADDNSISINLSAPFYLKEASTRYQYRIDRLMSDWSPWNTSPVIPLYPESGEYTVKFRAMNILGDISGEESISFTIKPPFVQTFWFYLTASIGVIIILVVIIYLRERKLRYDKRILEGKVRERTSELELKKKQIEVQRDEIIKQKEEITGSITYASRIQNAILPEEALYRRLFKDYFVLFRPKDIVSGDFYWIHEKGDKVSFAVADCTGHGVPGAIMSMLGVSLLNEIASNSNGELLAGDILELLREKVIFSLKQTGSRDEATDGMDISLCILDKETNKLQFAGAFNPMWIVRDDKLTEFKADKMPIGFHLKLSKFNTSETTLEKGDALYLLSDGYYDQFGGEDDKRYSSGRLKRLIKEIAKLPMSNQKEILNKRFSDWKGNNEQIDDVLIFGIRI